MTDKPLTYLDHNATTMLRPCAREAVFHALDMPYNASAIHGAGRAGRQMVEEARGNVAALINCPASQVIFNSGATEANNTVLAHFKDERILTSSIEHVSVLDSCPQAQRIPVTTDGIVDLDDLESLLKAETTGLVSVMLVNNETGAIQPIDEISKLAKSHGAFVHCDAVQAAGRIAIDMNAMGIDFLSLSAHKIGGPQGAGALALGLCGETPVLLHGGGQEKSARAGTENVAGIAGFGAAALEAAALDLPSYQDTFETWLRETTDAVIYSANVPRVANTTFFAFPGIRAETVLISLDLEGIFLSNGSACSSGTVKPSHVLTAMGASEEDALCGLRLSTGWNTSADDIERLSNALEKLWRRIRDA